MKVVMHYHKPSSMLQLALFPEEYDYYMGIRSMQVRVGRESVKSMTKLIGHFLHHLEEVYSGSTQGEEWKIGAYKLSKMEVKLKEGHFILEHKERRVDAYLCGQCLQMHMDTLEDVKAQLERI